MQSSGVSPIPGQQQMPRGTGDEREVIARQTDAQCVALLDHVVHAGRTAARLRFAQHGNLIARAFMRRAAQRILPHVSRRQMNVDVRARIECRQIAAIRTREFETDDAVGSIVRLATRTVMVESFMAAAFT